MRKQNLYTYRIRSEAIGQQKQEKIWQRQRADVSWLYLSTREGRRKQANTSAAENIWAVMNTKGLFSSQTTLQAP